MLELIEQETIKQNPNHEKDNKLKEIGNDDFKKESVSSSISDSKKALLCEEDDLKKEILRERSIKELFIKSFPFTLFNWKSVIYQNCESFLKKIFVFYSPILHGKIIDSITNQKDPDLLWYYFKMNIGIYLYEFIISQICRRIHQKFLRKNSWNIKRLLLKSIAEKDIEFFDLFQTGELVQRINNIQTSSNDYLSIFFYIFREIIQCSILIKQLWSYTTDIIIADIIIITISLLLYFFSEKIQLRRQKDNTLENGESSYANCLNQFISNIRMIKSFNCEKKEIAKINALTDKLKPKIFSSAWFIIELQQLFGNCSKVILLLVAGLNAIQGKMTYGDLIVFQSFQSSLQGSLFSIKTHYTSGMNGLLGWQKFFEIYDYKPKIISLKNLKPEEIKGEIEFEHVSFVYPHKKTAKVLDSLSFIIKPGKVVAIAGQSGCGKTTIAYLLQRFYDPYEGEIRLDGNNLKDFNISWLRRKIGFVAQEPILNAGTIEENIAYGCETYTEEEMNEACRLANVTKFISDKTLFPEGLKSYVGERGVKVSGGQKQRIAIARALIKNSKILILDEATSALDSESENEVQTAIDNIIKERHITTLIIAHRLCTIKNADSILYLEKGTVIEQGTHNELIKLNGKYKQLVHKQID